MIENGIKLGYLYLLLSNMCKTQVTGARHEMTNCKPKSRWKSL